MKSQKKASKKFGSQPPSIPKKKAAPQLQPNDPTTGRTGLALKPTRPKSQPTKGTSATAPVSAPPPAPVPWPLRPTAAGLKSQPRRFRIRKTISWPSILLEGDAPPAPDVGGPGERYALGPAATPPIRPTPLQPPSDLPEGYGTERIFLTARDPHWLYAAWDLTAEQRGRYNALSGEGHLTVRTYINNPTGLPVTEIQVHPESKSWFIHVPAGGARYVAELGFYEPGGTWRRVALSEGTLTPPESVSPETAVEFATIPSDITLKKLFEVVQQAVSESVPLSETVQQLRTEGWAALPEVVPASVPKWTPAQTRALAQVVRLDDLRRVWMGSLEITEVVRRHLRRESSSAALAAERGLGGAPVPPGAPLVTGVPAISSPFGPEEKVSAKPKQFWLNVNAELVLYGSTEVDARVAVGGREIQLRPDGTFSYRFALPDGQYPLTISASSADGEDHRSAHLQFSRRTQHHGHVGAHSQNADLKPPLVAHLA